MAKFKFFLGAWEWKFFVIEIHNFFEGAENSNYVKNCYWRENSNYWKKNIGAKIQITEKKLVNGAKIQIQFGEWFCAKFQIYVLAGKFKFTFEYEFSPLIFR